MVEEQPYLQDFLKLGIKEVGKNKDGVIVVDIPTDKVNQFVELYLKVMKPGRWNEYVGPKTGFYFKMSDGKIKHLPFKNAEDQKVINRTLREFIPSWNINSNLWNWLAGVDIYSKWLIKSGKW